MVVNLANVISGNYRGVQGLKTETDNNVMPLTSGTLRSLEINSSVESTWQFTSQSLSNPLSDQRNDVFWHNSCSQMQLLHDYDHPLISNATSKQQQHQHHFFGRECGSPRSGKQDHQSLQPLSNELPKTIDFGYYLNGQRADKSSLSSTQLSMSIPMTSSDFFSRSTNSSKGKLIYHQYIQIVVYIFHLY